MSVRESPSVRPQHPDHSRGVPGNEQGHPPSSPDWLRYEQFIGLALKLLRIKFGIRQSGLAELISKEISEVVSQGYISRVERSKRGVSHSRLALICKHLDCTPSRVIAMAESLAANAPAHGNKTVQAAAIIGTTEGDYDG